MKNKGIIRLTIALLSIGLVAGVWAVDDSLKAGKNWEKQQSEELRKTEASMDNRIKEMYKMLERYHVLKKFDIQMTPGRTKFRKNVKGEDGKMTNEGEDQEYIELESYAFIEKSSIHPAKVGSKYKLMRLYFNGEKLSKVETATAEENFQEHTTTITLTVDPAPDTSEPKEDSDKAPSEEEIKDTQINNTVIRTQILVNRVVDSNKVISLMRDIEKPIDYPFGTPYEVTMKNVESTITNPLRVKFKREFYLPNLKYFEKLFRFTEEYQKRYGTGADLTTIERLKDSLTY